MNTHSAEETIAFGKRFAKILKPNFVVALSGQLGSGKTTFVKGIADGLGIDSEYVVSPSFTLIREYEGRDMDLFHCDLYRLENIQQIALLGLDDYLTQDGVLILEWAKKAGALLPDDHIAIEISVMAKEKRKFKISTKGNKYKYLKL